MKIAMVGLRAPWGTEGGIEYAVGHLAPRLVALGCEVTVFCRSRYNTLGPGIHHGVRLVNVNTIYTRHLEAFVHTAVATPRAIATADIVHLHATGPSLLAWMPRMVRRATVVTLHGLDWQRAKWGRGARSILKVGAWSAATFPHQIIAVGQHLVDHYQHQYGVTPCWIPNGVEPIDAAPLAAGKVSGLEPFSYLVFVGRIVPEKGLDRLIEAYGKSGIKLPLIIIGGATHMDEYMQRLKANAPAGVRMVGPRYGEARDALLANARAFVLPSTLEGFPLAPLEAMAAGRPVILSDIPPHRELLANAPEVGWIVPDNGWPEALRDIDRADPKDLDNRGRAGKVHVAEHYTWDGVAKRTLQVYQQALQAL